ncbi:MAG TPA: glyceraldehyde-3-phosphate dehydrogenase, partial [Saprospiraceae bacterium]|nr:glyceraldehyde-3-phosphate dehydrogenase [Saprospiraceae bacterium]
AIVLRPQMKDYYSEAKKRAALLMTDSVHGDFRGTVTIAEDGKSLTVNGNKILLIYAKDPADIDYTEYGLKDALVIDNTGVWRDGEALKAHLRPGVEHVMLTAPGKLMPNIVYGVNHETLDLENTKIFCAASCTTNAISPILKVMNESLGIEKGHIETVHAYTSDQNLLDNFHKKPRRGRSAPLNMVLTSTGAAEAIESVMPELKGKFTGNAVRVPTPNVSLAIMSLSLNTPTTKAALNQILKDASLHGPLVEQIQYSDSEEYVSTDAVGMTSACVLDAPSTIVSADGKNVIIYAWYDNEYGYTCQVVRVAKHAAQVRRPAYF